MAERDIAEELRHAAAVGSVNADNEQYCCNVTIEQAKLAAHRIRLLEEALWKAQAEQIAGQASDASLAAYRVVDPPATKPA